MNVAIVVPQYPFGGRQVYLNGSAVSVASRLVAMGNEVNIIDFNIDSFTSVKEQLKLADVIGITLTGSAYIPSVLELIKKLRKNHVSVSIMLGGVVVEKLEPEHFCRIFSADVIQIRGNEDLVKVFGCQTEDIPSHEEVSFSPVYKIMGEERLGLYLRKEGGIILSQGCKHNCKFCSAIKGKREKFRCLGVFEQDLRYLVEVARRQGLETISLYASSLDFFQNPETLQEYLETLARVQQESGVTIRVRALTCIDSFLQASRKVLDLQGVLKRAGVWCLAFGSDGFDKAVWKAQGKSHNTVEGLIGCLELCKEFGIHSEILMVFGYEQDTVGSLTKAVLGSLRLTIKYGSTIRPYLAKPLVPGNEGWKKMVDRVEEILQNPRKFYNLDFCCVGSKLTHPKTLHRWLCNAAYLSIIFLLTPVGRNTTFPLLPQGVGGIYGLLARAVNRLMPFDR